MITGRRDALPRDALPRRSWRGVRWLATTGWMIGMAALWGCSPAAVDRAATASGKAPLDSLPDSRPEKTRPGDALTSKRDAHSAKGDAAANSEGRNFESKHAQSGNAESRNAESKAKRPAASSTPDEIANAADERDAQPSETPEVRYRESRFFRQPDLFQAADDPRILTTTNEKSLPARDEVFGVVVNGRARAYPIAALCYHHVVNDRIGDQPIAVTYCVICSSGIAFDPVVDGERLMFGFHGIWQGTAVLYDRGTKSNWLHLNGECVEGQWKGRRLRAIAGTHATWAEWWRDYPETELMAVDPQFVTRYFPRSSASRGQEYFPAGFLRTIQNRDRRLGLSELCFGVELGGIAKAYPFRELAQVPAGVLQEEIAGQGVLIVHELKSGTTRAMLCDQPAGRLEFEIDQDPTLLREKTSGSRFTRFGRGLDGPLKDLQLPLANGLQAEWYGWHALHPDTSLYRYRAP